MYSGVIAEKHSGDSILDFLYIFPEAFSNKVLQSDVDRYLTELRQNILEDVVDEYNGTLEINPVFFQKNLELSKEIFPILTSIISEYSNIDIQITSGRYTLLLAGYSGTGNHLLPEGCISHHGLFLEPVKCNSQQQYEPLDPVNVFLMYVGGSKPLSDFKFTTPSCS